MRLKLVHPLGHLENDLDARAINPEVADVAMTLLEPLDVSDRLESDLAVGAGRMNQAQALVVAQRLGMHSDELGGDADYVTRLFIVIFSILSIHPVLLSARSI